VWSVTDDAWSVHRFTNFSAFIFPGFGNFDRTYTNALKYRSPSFGGFQGAAVFSYGESAGSNKRGSAGELGLTYEAGSTAVFLSHSVTYNTATAPVADKLTVLAARHGIGQFTLRGAWLASRPEGSGLADTSIWLAGADYAITPLFSVGADHLRRKVDDSSKGNGVTRVLVNYEMSKRTGLYAYFARLTNRGGDNQSFRGSVSADASQTGINVGIRHRF
jgi:predicted porin